MNIYKFKDFEKFANKEHIPDSILVKSLNYYIQSCGQNTSGADLGSGLIKLRIAGKGKGKSGGYRVIVCLKLEDKAFFMYGYSKSARENITRQEEAEYKEAAGLLLAMNEAAIASMLADGSLIQIEEKENGKEV